jgi:two-component system chemotaxis response regulator CheB
MSEKKLKLLIVDDTALYRKILKDVFENFKEVEVIGTAPNGKIALEKMKQMDVDLVTLDVEMPELNGIETLKRIKQNHPSVGIIMVSSLTTRDASITMEALNLGAFDFIAKPAESNILENVRSLQEQFRPKLKAFLAKKGLLNLPLFSKPQPPQQPNFNTVATFSRPAIIAIGISTGGPKALADVIPQLPKHIGIPIVIVQHMPPVFTKALAESLDQKSKVTVQEAEDGTNLQPGYVYIAPGGKQMKIEKDALGKRKLKITNDPPENHCKPSVDYLLRSVAAHYKGNSLGVIMTGMGKDGALGLRLMKRYGANILAQDKESCVVFGMPMEAIKANIVDLVLPLNKIAAKITEISTGK